MGNLCGKQESDSFNSPGRTLGSAPPQPKTAAVPVSATASKPAKVGGPPRTLGGSSGGASSEQDARRKAAEAAEARAKGKPTGKLGDRLAAQKKQTRNDTLKEASASEARQREIDANNEAFSHR